MPRTQKGTSCHNGAIPWQSRNICCWDSSWWLNNQQCFWGRRLGTLRIPLTMASGRHCANLTTSHSAVSGKKTSETQNSSRHHHSRSRGVWCQWFGSHPNNNTGTRCLYSNEFAQWSGRDHEGSSPAAAASDDWLSDLFYHHVSAPTCINTDSVVWTSVTKVDRQIN